MAVTADASIFKVVNDFFEPMWVEICFVLFFPLGWYLVSKTLLKKTATKGKTQRGGISQTKEKQIHKAMEDAVAAGQSEELIRLWRQTQSKVPTPGETLRQVVWALAAESPETLLDEIVLHLEQHRHPAYVNKAAVVVLDVLSASNNPELLDEMYEVLGKRYSIERTYQIYESLLGGHASAGHEGKVFELIAEVHASNQRLTARAHALIIKGFLVKGLLDSALKCMQAMRAQGFFLPPFAVALILKVASEAGRAPEIFRIVRTEVTLPPEGIFVLFEDCAKRCDLELANEVATMARAANDGKLPSATYGALLKVKVIAGDISALEVFAEMQELRVRLSDAFCVTLMSRCADSKFLRFAEELARVVRAQKGMTISLYSALMKVYGYCGLYGRACDLYEEIIELGLQPDSVMYGCLMKFAVEAGRPHLLEKFFDASPQPHIQNYVALIRAAGREKNVDRAFEVLGKLEASGLKADRGVYNCIMDACVSAGDIERARGLMVDMRAKGLLDIVSYNIMLKGFLAVGDAKGAQELFLQIEKEGLKPDEITYNCRINAAVSCGNFRLAWDTVDAMEWAGVKVDKFTVSIMLKALKNQSGRGDLQRALALLDRSGIDICCDGALLNIAIETCVRHREMQRLQELLVAFESSSLQPTMHTYASLIKACSALENMDKCMKLWQQMTEERDMEPNDIVLGCMLDALVVNQRVNEAVALFGKWKTRVGTNMVLYSTLVKGFAAAGRADEAMEMWREIRRDGGQMNSVVYNSLIDVQARLGAMEQALELFKGMEEDGVAPDSITYSTLVKGYGMSGDLSKAFEMFRSTQAAGMAPDCIVYNTILDSCTRHNRMDLADQVLQDMDKHKITPSNFTLGILVKMYGRRRQLDKAFEVIDTLPAKHNLVPNVQVITCLISACVCNNALLRGVEVFEKMKKRGDNFVDSKAYGVIISGFVRAGNCKKATELVREAYGVDTGKRMLPPKQQLSPDILEQLMRSLAQRGLQQELGVPLLESLRAAKVPLNGRVLSSALDRGATAAPTRRGEAAW